MKTQNKVKIKNKVIYGGLILGMLAAAFMYIPRMTMKNKLEEIQDKIAWSRGEFFDVFPENSFKYSRPGANSYVPQESLYGKIEHDQDYSFVYRVVLSCDNTKVFNREKIDISAGYLNYTCTNRREAQCYKDGTFDKYYIEYCE